MTKAAKYAAGIGAVLVALMIIAVLTVGSKRWWIARIRARWDMKRWVYDDQVGRWVLDVQEYGSDPSKYQLADLIRTYYAGSEGWTRNGEEKPAPDSSVARVGPTGVPIVVTG